PLDEGDTLQHSLPAALRCVLYAASGAHSMDGLRGRQPLDINLFKSMTSTCFTAATGLFRRPTIDAYILPLAKTL
ncbi:hypothetical protein, partial [Pseudomonas fluorescens]|uniref:hypothetical protein n=1 Tax=Pseudomonas fluorescens TaxID=294 RepID=UPI001BB17A89